MLSDAQSGLLMMEDLNQGWRVGTLERMLDPKIVDAVIAARRLFQAGQTFIQEQKCF